MADSRSPRSSVRRCPTLAGISSAIKLVEPGTRFHHHPPAAGERPYAGTVRSRASSAGRGGRQCGSPSGSARSRRSRRPAPSPASRRHSPGSSRSSPDPDRWSPPPASAPRSPPRYATAPRRCRAAPAARSPEPAAHSRTRQPGRPVHQQRRDQGRADQRQNRAANATVRLRLGSHSSSNASSTSAIPAHASRGAAVCAAPRPPSAPSSAAAGSAPPRAPAAAPPRHSPAARALHPWRAAAAPASVRSRSRRNTGR